MKNTWSVTRFVKYPTKSIVGTLYQDRNRQILTDVPRSLFILTGPECWLFASSTLSLGPHTLDLRFLNPRGTTSFWRTHRLSSSITKWTTYSTSRGDFRPLTVGWDCRHSELYIPSVYGPPWRRFIDRGLLQSNLLCTVTFTSGERVTKISTVNVKDIGLLPVS